MHTDERLMGKPAQSARVPEPVQNRAYNLGQVQRTHQHQLPTWGGSPASMA